MTPDSLRMAHVRFSFMLCVFSGEEEDGGGKFGSEREEEARSGCDVVCSSVQVLLDPVSCYCQLFHCQQWHGSVLCVLRWRRSVCCENRLSNDNAVLAFTPVHISHLHTFHTCTPFAPVHIYTCTPFTPVHFLHLYTSHTCAPLTPVHISHLYTFHTCTPFTPVHLSHLYTFHHHSMPTASVHWVTFVQPFM